MKRLLVLPTLLVLLSVSSTQAQIAFWDFENICGPLPCLPIPASFVTSGISWALADMVGGNNSGSPPVCNGQETWATNFWPITPYPLEEYLSFSVEALPGYEIDVLSFYFSSVASSESSALLYDLYYLVNGTNAVFMGSGQHTPGTCTNHAFPQSIFVSDGGLLEFRLYPYGQSPSGRVATIRIDDVWIEGSVPLPADLLFFRGRLLNGSVSLEWAFSHLENGATVEVWRWDGSAFREIGRANDCLSGALCRWFDGVPLPGENVYKLRVESQDGRGKMFGPVAVQGNSLVRLRSNLVSGSQLVLLTPSSGVFRFEVYDLLGLKHCGGQNSGGEIHVPIGNLPSGTWLLRYQDETGMQGTLPFVKR